MKENINNETVNFGFLVSAFRNSFDLTQKELGNLLRLSRASVNRLEQIEDIKEVSDDLLFRFYYLTSRIMTSEIFDEIIKINAKKLYDIISITLFERLNDKADSFTLRLILRNCK